MWRIVNPNNQPPYRKYLYRWKGYRFRAGTLLRHLYQSDRIHREQRERRSLWYIDALSIKL